MIQPLLWCETLPEVWVKTSTWQTGHRLGRALPDLVMWAPKGPESPWFPFVLYKSVLSILIFVIMLNFICINTTTSSFQLLSKVLTNKVVTVFSHLLSSWLLTTHRPTRSRFFNSHANTRWATSDLNFPLGSTKFFLLLDTAGFRDKESFKKVSAVHYVQLP